MTVSRKRKRSIRVADQGYLWWVGSDDPLQSGSLAVSVRVVSESGDFYVKYFLGQPESVRHLVVIGRRFRAIAGCGAIHRRFRCPAIGNEESVTPSGISALIAWATEPSQEVEEVDFRGCVPPHMLHLPTAFMLGGEWADS
jgi:hypothetical protein